MYCQLHCNALQCTAVHCNGNTMHCASISTLQWCLGPNLHWWGIVKIFEAKGYHCSFYMYNLCNISQKPKICSWIPFYWSQDSPDSRQAKLALFDLLFFSESEKNHISRSSCWPFLKLVLMLEIFSFYWHFPSFEKRSPRFLSVFSHLLFKGKKQISSQLPRILCVEGNFGECRKLSVFS